MDNRELVFTKQTILAIKEWDAFQLILRTGFKAVRNTRANIQKRKRL